jgi:hypothetical protein
MHFPRNAEPSLRTNHEIGIKLNLLTKWDDQVIWEDNLLDKVAW